MNSFDKNTKPFSDIIYKKNIEKELLIGKR